MVNARLSVRTLATHKVRYALGALAVATATAFIVGGFLLIQALDAQMQAAGANNGGTSAGLFVLLGSFGLIVVIASSFVIGNSFQTMVASRTQELAMLRTVGMRSRQVFGSVLMEGALVGLAGALLGLLLGSGFAMAVAGLVMADAPMPLPGLGSVLLALGIGVGVSLIASLIPARVATRVAPVAAVTAGQTMASEPLSVRRRIAGIAVLVLGAGLAVMPVGKDAAALAFVLGSLVVFAGMAMLAPLAVPRVAQACARLLRGDTVGHLAARNLDRGQRRVASTAMAVVLGMTLFSGVMTVLSSAMAAAAAAGRPLDDAASVYGLAIGLTAFTVIVGLIGVMNTIVLSVRERAGELALLRAVGMSRREVRRTVTVEAAIVGAVGVLAGLGFGLLGSATLLARLAEPFPLVAPWGWLVGVGVTSMAFVVGSTRVVAGRAAKAAASSATAVA